MNKFNNSYQNIFIIILSINNILLIIIILNRLSLLIILKTFIKHFY